MLTANAWHRLLQVHKHFVLPTNFLFTSNVQHIHSKDFLQQASKPLRIWHKAAERKFEGYLEASQLYAMPAPLSLTTLMSPSFLPGCNSTEASSNFIPEGRPLAELSWFCCCGGCFLISIAAARAATNSAGAARSVLLVQMRAV